LVHSKKSLVLFAAAVVLLAGAPVAHAGHDRTNERDSGINGIRPS
jgi:hypothetical protein